MYRLLIYTLVFPLDIRTSEFIIQPKNMPGLKFEALGKDARERATVSQWSAMALAMAMLANEHD